MKFIHRLVEDDFVNGNYRGEVIKENRELVFSWSKKNGDPENDSIAARYWMVSKDDVMGLAIYLFHIDVMKEGDKLFSERDNTFWELEGDSSSPKNIKFESFKW